MRKRVIIIAVAVIALAGIYFGLTKLNKEDEGGSQTASETISIFKTEKDNIVSITITTPDFEYTLYKQDDKWLVLGSEDIKLNNSKVESLAYNFASINAGTIIENPSDLSAYGFGAPAGTPSIKLADGDEKGFVIGSKTPTGTEYYFKTADSDTIYSVYSSKIESFIAPLETYRDQNLASVDTASLTEIKIKRSDADIVMQAKTEGEEQTFSTWRMVTPYSKDVSSYGLDEYIIKKITGFQISKFAEDNPSSYAPYGLDKPKYIISLTEKDKSPVTFLLGNAVEDEFYVRLENESPVYTIKQSAFEFKDVDPMLLIDTLIYIQNIDTVDTISFYTPDSLNNLKITRDGEAVSYFINDTSASEGAFKKIYQEVIGLLLRGMVAEEPDGEPLFRAIFKFNNGRADDVIEAVPYRERYAAIKVNGKAEYYVMKDQVLTLIKKVKEFAENPNGQ